MQKTSKTFEQRACAEVKGFKELSDRVKKRMAVLDRARSTSENYCRSLSQMALFHNISPLEISAAQLNDYLFFIRQTMPSASNAYFKFAVFSLRFVYKMEGLDTSKLLLPKIKTERKMPVVLSRNEVKSLIASATSQKHKCLLLLLYGCGLRCSEVRKLMVMDVDLDRGMLLVRMGKGGKDRYLPLCESLITELGRYIKKHKLKGWLFQGSMAGGKHYSSKGIQWVVQSCGKRAGILKNLNVHTLRHTYATHLLESGLDIVSIKELLGHGTIETTMVYLHVAKCSRIPVFSPLETLYGHYAAPEQSYRNAIHRVKQMLEQFN